MPGSTTEGPLLGGGFLKHRDLVVFCVCFLGTFKKTLENTKQANKTKHVECPHKNPARALEEALLAQGVCCAIAHLGMSRQLPR